MRYKNLISEQDGVTIENFVNDIVKAMKAHDPALAARCVSAARKDPKLAECVRKSQRAFRTSTAPTPLLVHGEIYPHDLIYCFTDSLLNMAEVLQGAIGDEEIRQGVKALKGLLALGFDTTHPYTFCWKRSGAGEAILGFVELEAKPPDGDLSERGLRTLFDVIELFETHGLGFDYPDGWGREVLARPALAAERARRQGAALGKSLGQEDCESPRVRSRL